MHGGNHRAPAHEVEAVEQGGLAEGVGEAGIDGAINLLEIVVIGQEFVAVF